MATPTISEYTSHLRVDKTNMRNYLATIGIDTKESDTFTELTKAVDRIRTQAPQLYTQEEEPAVKQGIWLKGSNITINQVLNDTDLYFKEELSYCDSNPLTAAHNTTYYYYLYSEGQTYLITPTKSGDSNDFTLYKVNPITLSLEFVVRAKTGINCSISKTFIRKNILYIGNVAQANLTYLRYDMTTGEKLSNFLFDAKYNNTSTSTRAWSSNVIYNEKYDALFVGEAKTNNYDATYLHRYDFETGKYTAIAHKYGTRSSGFKLHAHPECILVNGSYRSREQQYTNVYKIGSKTMVSTTGYGDYGVDGFSNSAILGGKTYLDIGKNYYNVFDYDVATDKITIKSKVYWKEDQSALNPTITTIIPLYDRLILLNPAASNRTYYSFGGIDKVYPDKTLVLFQGNQINSAKFSTQLMPSALLSGKALVTPYNAIYYYTDEYGYNSPYPIYYGNGKRWVPVAPSSSEDTDDFEPLLQDKSVEITENGTQTIVADEGYDGLNSVEVITDIGGGDLDPNASFEILEWTSKNPSTIRLVEGVTSLPSCFKPKNNTSGFGAFIKKIILPSTVTGIYENEFENYAKLEEVNLENIQRFYNGAFKGCASLKSATLSEGINTGSGFSRNPNKLQHSMFDGCSQLEHVNIPSNIIGIGYRCFAGCSNLIMDELPEGITEIGPGYLPSGGYSDSGYVFSGCNNITFSKLPDSLINMYGPSNFSGCSKITISTLPDSITNLAGSTFSNCTAITTFNTNNVQRISNNEFSDCTGLVSIVMPNLIQNNASSQSRAAFQGCTALKAVWIGSSVTKLTNYTFRNCTALQKIYIDLPRETASTLAGYAKGYTYDVDNSGKVIYNDDEGFITQAEFEAIDWSTYTGE